MNTLSNSFATETHLHFILYNKFPSIARGLRKFLFMTYDEAQPPAHAPTAISLNAELNATEKSRPIKPNGKYSIKTISAFAFFHNAHIRRTNDPARG